MTGDLELTVLSHATEGTGYVAAFAVTDTMIVALGGTSSTSPVVLASEDARTWQHRNAPWDRGLRDVLALGDSVWACGEWGQLAVTRDHGETWHRIETGTEGCLSGLALGHDGALWVVGEDGYAARLLGDRLRRASFDTDVRLTAVRAVREEIVALGNDGQLRRLRDGKVTVSATGAQKPISGFAVTAKGTWLVVGDGGFIARSPDGQWFSRVTSTSDADLESIAVLGDGTLLVVGDRGLILRSTDDGRTWRQMPNRLGAVHLWAIARFGAGVLIGGDHGMIARLAPPDDATWRDRAPAASAARTLEAILATGPTQFVAKELPAYLDAIATPPPHADADELVADDDEDEDELEDELAALDAEDGGITADPEAFEVLAARGDAVTFQAIYGMALPFEAERFFTATAHAPPLDSFEELLLDRKLLPDPGDRNLFELLVRRNQHSHFNTDLVDAFCGTLAIGSLSDGDSYHLELYGWDGPRQVLQYDHERGQLTGVVADSLDALVYLAAIAKAGDEARIPSTTYRAGLAKLRGRVAPSWHFDIEERDPKFHALAAKRRDTAFFFHRARWIMAMLARPDAAGIGDLPALFDEGFNGIVAASELPARLEQCKTLIPVALYAMWRAYLFDEPELDTYLEIARGHAARLVRDAAKLVEELRAGRITLGAIADWPARLAAFRALDLDPRRADARRAEAEARSLAEAERRREVEAQLAATDPSGWGELAWQWLDDRVAQRVLVEWLESTQPSQVHVLEELRELRTDERELEIPLLAKSLTPEIEAVLVGSLVRGDLVAELGGDASNDDADDDEESEERDDEDSPGWDAIDDALRPIYGDLEPQHFGTELPYMLGGNDPLHGISVYPREHPVPHWHFITYGFTDLFHKETDDPDESGFGFELTFRLARSTGEAQPPSWALNFLQNLGRYVFGTGNRFAAGHKMGLNGPIALDTRTQISAICFADDPELGDIQSPFGRARFVQIVGITDDEYRLIQEWSTTGLLELLQRKLPMLVTDLDRKSVLDDPATAAEVEQRVEQEGSSEDLTFAGELGVQVDDGHVRLELGALYAAALPRAMRGRIRHGRGYELRGREATIHLEAAEQVGYRHDNGELVLQVTRELATELDAKLRGNLAGTYRFTAWPALEIVVTPSFIRSQEGNAIDVRGVADPDEVRELLDAENARLAATAADDDADGSDDDDDEDDDTPPDPARVVAALAMTERALRLAPHDLDVQFTHAMLLADAERAGVPGKDSELFEWLPRFAPAVRMSVATRLGERDHARFADAVDLAMLPAMPGTPIADELFADLGDVVIERAPSKLPRLIPILPEDVNLMSELAWKAIQAGHREGALALYERLLEMPIPDEGDERTNYLRALNNACVQAHAAKAFDAAVRIADRAQPVAHENPYIFHSAACAYAAVGDFGRALDQVKLAMQHGYDHLSKVEVDSDLGALLDSAEFKALFRDWRARQEGN